MSKSYGIGLLVDTVKTLVTFSTSIIAAIYGALILKGPLIAGKSNAMISTALAGVSVLFGLIFLFHVAERNMKEADPHPGWSYAFFGMCWLPFLLAVLFAAMFGFEMANAQAAPSGGGA